MFRRRAWYWLGIALASASACSSASKKIEPELARLEGKKVALVSVEGQSTSRAVVEAALINQLISRGTFEIISKQTVEAARSAPEQDPVDLRGIARRAGADYGLRAEVLEFDAETREGYSSEEVEDSQLAAERGESERKTQRYFKAKSLTGKIRVRLEFIEISSGDSRTAIAEADGSVSGEARQGGIHLPPRLRFLEDLSNEAFRRFFERYN